MKRHALLLAGPAALLAAPVDAQVADFRLQPAPTPTPDLIGPPAETPAPRPSPTPTPTIATPAPAPPPRISLPPVATATPTQRPSANAPAARPSAAASATATPAPVPATASPPAPTANATLPQPAPIPALPGATIGTPEKPAGSWWPWILGVFFLGGAAFAGLWWLRRRIGPVGALVVPEIERPRVPPAPPPVPEPAAEPVAAVPQAAPRPAAPSAEPHPLHIAIELRKLTLTLMNATLGYRLTLTNGGTEPLEDIAIAADLIGAHSSLPREMQLAGLETELPVNHRVAGLAPGESGDVTGEVRVPLSQLRPITRGRAQLFVPLARFRIGAQGQEPRCFTLVAGQPSPSGNGAIQPVRLDHGPRIYDGLAGRAF